MAQPIYAAAFLPNCHLLLPSTIKTKAVSKSILHSVNIHHCQELIQFLRSMKSGLIFCFFGLLFLGLATGKVVSCSFPAVYNFGDSNSDTGGRSAAFVEVPPPYGETFFKKPSGRLSDGRLLIDFIGGIGFFFSVLIFNLIFYLLHSEFRQIMISDC